MKDQQPGRGFGRGFGFGFAMTVSGIRDRGSVGDGRSCAAFIGVDKFEFHAEYTTEPTKDGQIVVSATFGPK